LNCIAKSQTFLIQIGQDSLFILFDSNSVEFVMSFAYLKNLIIFWNIKRYFKIVNSNFLLVQTSCLCFKMVEIPREKRQKVEAILEQLHVSQEIFASRIHCVQRAFFGTFV